MIMMGERGTPALMAFENGCIHHYQDHVEVLFVEVKRTGNKPTPAQEIKMKELEEFGARCIVATCVEDVEKALLLDSGEK